MFSFLKPKKFYPNFPIIDLEANPKQVFETLAKFSNVERDEESDDENADFSYVAETDETRIHVCFYNDKITYVNYLTMQFNDTDKQKGQKLRWFLDYYGGVDEFDAPRDTGYMVFCKNPKKKITVVLGLHMGPIRINRH